MTRPSRFAVALVVPAALALSLVLAGPAAAEVKTQTFRVGPIKVGPYQVKTNYNSTSQLLSQIGQTPKPDEDGFITNFEVNLVDPDGSLVPIKRLMLHHIVFQNVGPSLLSVQNAACQNFTLFDSKSTVPAAFDPFAGRGEEGAKLALPKGYGYPMHRDDKWGVGWMFMNHRNKSDSAFIEYKVTYDTSPDITPVKPVWLDVAGCSADPVFTVPGGGKRGSTYTKSKDWTPPSPGRLVAGGGHVHGGAKNLVLSEPGCGNRKVTTSEPTWGLPSHPFYNVRPILHEPGPIKMSGFQTQQGIPVTPDKPIRLTARYDAELTHPRVMGIMVVYFVPDSKVTDECAPLPGDLVTDKGTVPGRHKPPRFLVPLTGLDSHGKAHSILRPPGATRRLANGSTVDVGNFYFGTRNISIPRGTTLNWDFKGANLHNVTVANGVRGFHSLNLSDDRTYTKRFTVPGTYRLFCALHPVKMTETVTVR